MSNLPDYSEVSPAEVLQKWEHDPAVRLVDVRTLSEYQSRHIPNILHLPLDELAARFRAELHPSQEIIIICEHGVRSDWAAQFLAAQQFPRVATMLGGMAEYSGPIESGDAAE